MQRHLYILNINSIDSIEQDVNFQREYRYYLLIDISAVPDTFLFWGVWGFRFGADDSEPVNLDRQNIARSHCQINADSSSALSLISELFWRGSGQAFSVAA